MKILASEDKSAIEKFMNNQKSTRGENLIQEAIASKFADLKFSNVSDKTITAESNFFRIIATCGNKKNVFTISTQGYSQVEVSDFIATLSNNQVFETISSKKYDFTKSDVATEEIVGSQIKTYDGYKLNLTSTVNLKAREFVNFGIVSQRTREKTTNETISTSEKSQTYFEDLKAPSISTNNMTDYIGKDFDYQELRTIYGGRYVVVSKMNYGGIPNNEIGLLDFDSEDLRVKGVAVEIDQDEAKVLLQGPSISYSGQQINPKAIIEKISRQKR